MTRDEREIFARLDRKMEAFFARHPYGLEKVPEHWKEEEMQALWYRARGAMSVLDALRTLEQLQALRQAIDARVKELTPQWKPHLTRGYRFLIDRIRTGHDFQPICVRGCTVCAAFSSLCAAVVDLTACATSAMAEIFPGATPYPPIPPASSYIGKVTMYRPYPKALKRVVRDLDQSGALAAISPPPSATINEVVGQRAACNVCRTLLLPLELPRRKGDGLI